MKFPVFLLLLLFLPLTAAAQPPSGDSLLIISLQRDFNDIRRFSEEPMVRWAEFDPKTGLELWSDLDKRALIEAVRNKDALILIHGMGMPLSWSMRHYRKFSHHPLPYDLVIGIVWPAGEKKKSSLFTPGKIPPSAFRQTEKWAAGEWSALPRTESSSTWTASMRFNRTRGTGVPASCFVF